jgi:hypothetical protein
MMYELRSQRQRKHTKSARGCHNKDSPLGMRP